MKKEIFKGKDIHEIVKNLTRIERKLKEKAKNKK